MDSGLSDDLSGAWPARVAAWPQPAAIVVFLIALLWGIALAGFALYRHWTFNSGAWDLGIAYQTIWNTGQGRVYENTFSDSGNHLGEHLGLVHLSFAPPVWIGFGPELLLVVQAVFLVLPAAPLYWYGRLRLGGWLAAIAPMAYLAHPTLAATASFDFRESMAAPLPIALCLFGLLTGRRQLFVASGLAMLLVREDLGLTLAGIAFGAVLRPGWRRIGLAMFAAGLAWTSLALVVVIPAFHNGLDYFSISRSRNLGGWDLLGTALRSPIELITAVLPPRKILFVLEMALSFGGWPVLAPLILSLALPSLLVLLAGQYRTLTDIASHYPLLLLPFFAYATVDGLAFLRQRISKAATYLAGAASLILVMVTALPHIADLAVRRLDNGLASDLTHLALAREMLAIIPADASVSAQTGLVPHVAGRREIFLFPRLGGAEWVALDTRGQRYVVGEGSYEDGLFEIVCDTNFGVVFDKDGLLLFKRGAQQAAEPSSLPTEAIPINVSFGESIRLAGYVISKPIIRPDELPDIVLFWEATSTAVRDWTVFVHLVDSAGNVRGQYDSPPRCGDAPSGSWKAGRLVRDEYRPIPQRRLAAGTYRVRVGMYDPLSGARPRTARGEDWVDLGSIEIR